MTLDGVEVAKENPIFIEWWELDHSDLLWEETNSFLKLISDIFFQKNLKNYIFQNDFFVHIIRNKLPQLQSLKKMSRAFHSHE